MECIVIITPINKGQGDGNLKKTNEDPQKRWPICARALASFHVCRQAYYSGTFVGNHVHTSLKVCRTYMLLLLIAEIILGEEHEDSL